MRLTKSSTDGRYYIKIETSSGPMTLPTGKTSKKEARDFAVRNNLHDIGDNFGPYKIIKKLKATRVSVDQAIEEYTTHMKDLDRSANYIYSNLSTVREFLEDSGALGKSAEFLNSEMVQKFINRDSNLKLSTRKVKLAHLNLFLKFLHNNRYTRELVGQEVVVHRRGLTNSHKEKRSRKCFTDNQVRIVCNRFRELAFEREQDEKRLQRQIDQSLKDPKKRAAVSALKNHLMEAAKQKRILNFFWSATLLGRYTGLRLSDIAQLRQDSLKDDGSAYVWTSKTNARVEFILSQPIKDALAMADPDDEGYLFPEAAEISQSSTRRAYLSILFGRYMARFGIKDRTFHDLRSTFATVSKRKGGEIADIAESLGHADPGTTMKYIVEEE